MPVRWLIRARSASVVREQCMERIQAHHGGACVRGFRGEPCQRGKVADALITARSKGIQMRRNAEAALAG